MITHHPVKFGDHGHCSSGEIMFPVVEEQNSKCFHLNPSLLFISKGHDFKAHGMWGTNVWFYSKK